MFDRNAPSSIAALAELRNEDLRRKMLKYALWRTNVEADADDALNRVTGALMTVGAPANASSSSAYAYDGNGNLMHKDGKTYTYGGCQGPGRSGSGLHQVCSIDGGPTFVYDAAGNLTANGERSVSYNAHNKAVQITGAAGTSSFMVDGASTDAAASPDAQVAASRVLRDPRTDADGARAGLLGSPSRHDAQAVALDRARAASGRRSRTLDDEHRAVPRLVNEDVSTARSRDGVPRLRASSRVASNSKDSRSVR